MLAEQGRLRLSASQLVQLATLLAGENVRTLQIETVRGPFRIRLAPDAVPPDSGVGVTDQATRIVVAGTVGEFLTGHPHRREALVRPGGYVAPGDVLGLIRIGPLLTPVIFEAEGGDAMLAEVLAESGTIVGYGTPLFRVMWN